MLIADGFAEDFVRRFRLIDHPTLAKFKALGIKLAREWVRKGGLAKTRLGQLQVGTKILRLMSQAKPDVPAIDRLAEKHPEVAAWAGWEPCGFFDPGALANELTA